MASSDNSKAWFRISCVATGSQCKRTTNARIEPSSILVFARAFTLTSGRDARYSEPGLSLFTHKLSILLSSYTCLTHTHVDTVHVSVYNSTSMPSKLVIQGNTAGTHTLCTYTITICSLSSISNWC